MAKVNEPRQNQKTKSYQQKKLAIHDIPFDCCERLSNRKYIIETQKTSFLFIRIIKVQHLNPSGGFTTTWGEVKALY